MKKERIEKLVAAEEHMTDVFSNSLRKMHLCDKDESRIKSDFVFCVRRMRDLALEAGKKSLSDLM